MKNIFIFYLLILVNFYHSQNLMWAKQFAGNNSQVYPEAVTTDQNGNVLTTGIFVGFADFDPGPGNAYLSSTFPTSNNPQYTDIFVSKLNLAGLHQWAWNFRKVGGTGSGGGEAVCTDAAGNVYVTGFFSGSVNFEPTFTTNYVLTAFGSSDIFVLKLDPNGNFVWAVQMGGTSGESGLSIAVDPTGNVYTTGSFSGVSDFNPGTGTYTLSAVGGEDIFISKLDPSGNFLWAKSMGDISNDKGATLVLDNSSNVAVAGIFYGTVDFNPGPGTYTLSSVVGTIDAFFMKLDNNGNFMWAKQIAGSATDNINAMALDSPGNIYLAGAFNSVADFDPGPSTYTLNSYGSSDIFVSKYDASGNFIWTSRMGGPSGEEAYGITLNPSGEIFTTGAFLTICDFDPGVGTYTLSPTSLSQDIFLSRLSATGGFVSAKRIGGTGTEWGKKITADISGDIIFTGHFAWGTGIDFDPGPGTYTIASVSDDGFVTKFSDCITPATITAVPSNTLICSGQSLTITASGASTYTLYHGNTIGAIQIVTPTVSTVYTLIGTNSVNCKDAKSFNIIVNPSGTVTTVSSNSVLCSGQTATLTATGAYTFTWSTASNSSSISVTPTVSTTYTVIGTNSSGCSYLCTFTQSVSPCTGFDNYITSNQNLILISPNPNVGDFLISSVTDLDLMIINETGQLVSVILLNNANNRQKHVYDLASGMYFIVGNTELGIIRQKIIVIK